VSSVVPPVTGTGTADDATKMSEEEIKRRQVIISRANKAIYDADRLRSAGELESAAKRYQYVVDVTAPTGKTAFINGKARANLAATRADLGKIAMDNKDYKAAYENYEIASKLFPQNAAYSERLAKAREKWQKEGGTIPLSSVQSASSTSSSTASSSRVRRVRRSGAREKMESSTYRTRGENAVTPASAPVPQAGSRARVSDPAAGF
jgi:tetratricopeptide (TPR) repeat protein